MPHQGQRSEGCILPRLGLNRRFHCRYMYNAGAVSGTLPPEWGNLTQLKEL
jgi:hypothetical protein